MKMLGLSDQQWGGISEWAKEIEARGKQHMPTVGEVKQRILRLEKLCEKIKNDQIVKSSCDEHERRVDSCRLFSLLNQISEYRGLLERYGHL